jgi:phosphatidylserine decarboxylase
MPDRFAVSFQQFFPKQALTVFAGWVAGRERGWVTTEIIRRFVAKYQVNMAEALDSNIASYPTFNAFFTRALKPGARPLADADLVCPVDGAVSQLGAIEKDQIFQAKGHHYSTTAVLGGNAALAAQFEGGHFATIYLSPKDYHRIHMPCDGVLKRMVYVPGELFSVNPSSARSVPGLFARNERVVCLFDSPQGAFALILIGATIVGSMATPWHGVINPPRSAEQREWLYPAGEVSLKQGEEMGRFLLGSTVILLFPKGPLQFNPAWVAGRGVRLGEAMGEGAGEQAGLVSA